MSNPTSLLRHIKMMLGVPYKQIPISDEDIMDILTKKGEVKIFNIDHKKLL